MSTLASLITLEYMVRTLHLHGRETRKQTAPHLVVLTDDNGEMNVPLLVNIKNFVREYVWGRKDVGLLKKEETTFEITDMNAVNFLYHIVHKEDGRYKHNYTEKNEWAIVSNGLFDLGWWLHTASKVTVSGSIKAKLLDSKTIEITSVRTNWTWYDQIDANSFEEGQKNIEDINIRNMLVPGNVFRMLGWDLEGYWDLFNEKINAADFDIQIKWTYDSDESYRIPVR